MKTCSVRACSSITLMRAGICSTAGGSIPPMREQTRYSANFQDGWTNILNATRRLPIRSGKRNFAGQHAGTKKAYRAVSGETLQRAESFFHQVVHHAGPEISSSVLRIAGRRYFLPADGETASWHTLQSPDGDRQA